MTAEYHGDLPMRVSNVGFMIDKLGQDAGPLQFLRELTQNSIQAIQATSERKGEILWGYDPLEYDDTGVMKLSIVDTGLGMTGPEMIELINHAFRSIYEQGFDKNYGIGAKVAAATRNHHGLRYLSWKDGEGAMVRLRRNPYTGQYGFEQFELEDGSYSHWAPLDDLVKPEIIGTHGTAVILEGNSAEEDTFRMPDGVDLPSTRWVASYLNRRYFRVPERIELKAMDINPYKRVDDSEPVRRTPRITGMKRILDQQSESSGTVALEGADAHWWILRAPKRAVGQDRKGRQPTGPSSGHTAALFQDELYEMLQRNRGGVSRLHSFGVTLGDHRVVIYLEPHSSLTQRVQANTARTHLLINGEPLPWSDWQAEFQKKMPQEIQALMDAIAMRTVRESSKDDIKKRLEPILSLFNPSRYKTNPEGNVDIEPPGVIGGKPEPAEQEKIDTNPPGGKGGKGGKSIYSHFITKEGKRGERIKRGPSYPECRWVSVANGSRVPPYLEDSAASYVPERNEIHINADFRVFGDVTKYLRKENTNIAGGAITVNRLLRFEIEAILTQVVLGVAGLEGSKEWPEERIKSARSEEGMTAAVMPRDSLIANLQTELRRLTRKREAA